MQVHRARANRASARQGDARLAEARNQRPQSEDRGAHRAHQFVGRAGSGYFLRGNGQIGWPRVCRFDARIHVREQTAHRRDVAHAGNVVEMHGLGSEQRRRHGGQRGIFRAADAHRAAQLSAACDSESVHEIVPAPVEANEMVANER